MGLYIVNIHGDIEGDYEIIKKYEEPKTNKELRFFISQYLDGNIEIECKHMHYAYDDRFNFDDFPKEELIEKMAEIQEHCEAEGMTAKFVIL